MRGAVVPSVSLLVNFGLFWTFGLHLCWEQGRERNGRIGAQKQEIAWLGGGGGGGQRMLQVSWGAGVAVFLFCVCVGVGVGCLVVRGGSAPHWNAVLSRSAKYGWDSDSFAEMRLAGL